MPPEIERPATQDVPDLPEDFQIDELLDYYRFHQTGPGTTAKPDATASKPDAGAPADATRPANVPGLARPETSGGATAAPVGEKPVGEKPPGVVCKDGVCLPPGQADPLQELLPTLSPWLRTSVFRPQTGDSSTPRPVAPPPRPASDATATPTPNPNPGADSTPGPVVPPPKPGSDASPLPPTGPISDVPAPPSPDKPATPARPSSDAPTLPQVEIVPFVPGLPTDKPNTPNPTDRVEEPTVPPQPEVRNDGPAPAVAAYLARQGARRAGSGGGASDLPIPPGPGRPGGTPDSPIRPADFRPTPSDNTTVRPDARPAEVKEKYTTAEMAEAVEAARRAGLPLVVHVGASWCGPCRDMERNVWPGVEQSMKGKAVFVHMDVDQARRLTGAAGDLGRTFQNGVSAYPTIRVFNPGQAGEQPSLSQSHRGGFGDSRSCEQWLASNGVTGVRREQPQPNNPVRPADYRPTTDVPTPPSPVRPGGTDVPPSPGPNPVRPADYRPTDDVPTPPSPNPDIRPRPSTPQPEVRPRPTTPQPEQPRPSDQVRPTDQVRPQPEAVEIKERYDTADVSAAIDAARRSGLPLVVHVGASWCGPCQSMDQNVWPSVERDLKGKAVFLHIDGDQMRRMTGDAGNQARQLASGVSSYPTIRVFNVGQTGDPTRTSSTGPIQSVSGMMNHLSRNGIRR